MVDVNLTDIGEPSKAHSALNLKPVIKEIIRTQFCPPLRLLVDRVHVVRYGDEKNSAGAYRLWLSDGQKSIQGRREIHPFLSTREIQDGSIVLVTKYQLSKVRRRSGKGDVWVLLIESLQPIGFDGRTSRKFQVEQRPKDRSFSTSSNNPTDSSFERLLSGLGEGVERDEKPSGDEVEDDPPSPSELAARKKRRIEGPSTPSKGRQRDPVAQALGAAKPPPHAAPLPPGIPGFEAPAGPDQLRKITRPLKLTALASITGPKASRNRVVDVVGIICEVSRDVIKRSKMPDQRDLRIMDPSTTKRVQLTVFVDAQNFTPALGTVALMRSVTTHEYNGGSLKAYPRDCEGREWFFPNPVWLEGFDPEEFRSWWMKTLAQEEAEKEEYEHDS